MFDAYCVDSMRFICEDSDGPRASEHGWICGSGVEWNGQGLGVGADLDETSSPSVRPVRWIRAAINSWAHAWSGRNGRCDCGRTDATCHDDCNMTFLRWKQLIAECINLSELPEMELGLAALCWSPRLNLVRETFHSHPESIQALSLRVPIFPQI
jgi:hypothetical protein